METFSSPLKFSFYFSFRKDDQIEFITDTMKKKLKINLFGQFTVFKRQNNRLK